MLKLLRKKAIAEAPIELGDIVATIKRSARRRTLTIKVEAGRVMVQAPHFSSRGDIEDFLRRKYRWILEKVQHQQTQLQACRRTWESGERLPYLGRELILRIEPGARGEVHQEDDLLRVRLRRGAQPQAVRVQALVQAWYRQEAVRYFGERVIHWQKLTGITAKSHAVKTYRARWGSCNHRAELSFNWKLMMAPPAVLDYVVVHELCHIVHMNHSPAYWGLVARHMPDYESHKRWLRQRGISLEL